MHLPRWEQLKDRIQHLFEGKPKILTAVKPGDAYHPRAASVLSGISAGVEPAFEPGNRHSNASPTLQDKDDPDSLNLQYLRMALEKDPDQKFDLETLATQFQEALKKNDKPPLIVIDSLGQLESDAFVRENVVRAATKGDVRVIVATAALTHVLGTAMASVSKDDQRALLLYETASENDRIRQMVDELEVATMSPIAAEKPWIEMNQPHRRRKKRSRPGRKFKD